MCIRDRSDVLKFQSTFEETIDINDRDMLLKSIGSHNIDIHDVPIQESPSGTQQQRPQHTTTGDREGRQMTVLGLDGTGSGRSRRSRAHGPRPRRPHNKTNPTNHNDTITTTTNDHDDMTTTTTNDDDDARLDVHVNVALMCGPLLNSQGESGGFVLPKSRLFGAAGAGAGVVPCEVDDLMPLPQAGPLVSSQSRIPQDGQGATAESQFGSGGTTVIGRLLGNDSLLGKVPAKESSFTHLPPGTTQSLQGKGTTRSLEGTTTAATAADQGSQTPGKDRQGYGVAEGPIREPGDVIGDHRFFKVEAK